MDYLETIQRSMTKIIIVWEICHVRKGWKNWLCSALRKESLEETILYSYIQYLKSGYKGDGGSLYRRSHMEKMRAKSLWRFWLDTRKISHNKNSLPRGVVDS